MKELSLNILDITKNSVRAEAKNISILLNEDEKGILTVIIEDDGIGMSKESLESATDPFFTTRKTRTVGMGIPLLKLACEQAGGALKLESLSKDEDEDDHGTRLTATFDTNNIDCMPVGDMASTIAVLIQGNPEIDYIFEHTMPNKTVKLSTGEIKAVLGEDIPLSSYEVLRWIKDYIDEQYSA
ncbi:MAG: ATP-binding protein [Ruminococcaceae bacterium]|nr:ATP-binding protein [Oscillospiraceae bacterium]